MIVLQFTLIMLSLSLLGAAWLAPDEAWLTPITSTSDNEVQDDVR